MVQGLQGICQDLAGTPVLSGHVSITPLRPILTIPRRPIARERNRLSMFSINGCRVDLLSMTFFDNACGGGFCGGTNLFDGTRTTLSNCSCFHQSANGNTITISENLKLTESSGETRVSKWKKLFDFKKKLTEIYFVINKKVVRNVINLKHQNMFTLKKLPTRDIRSHHILESPLLVRRIVNRRREILELLNPMHVVGWLKPGVVVDAVERDNGVQGQNNRQPVPEEELIDNLTVTVHISSMMPQDPTQVNQRAIENLKIDLRHEINRIEEELANLAD